MSGSFDCLDINRNKLFNSIDTILNYSNSIEKEKISNQQNLFSETDNNQLFINLPETYNWGEEEKLNNEFLSLGFYLSSHPLNLFLDILNEIQIIKSSEILENTSNYARKNIKLSGLVFKLQKRQSPRGKWATFQLNDLGGNCEVTLYSDTLLNYEHHLNQKKPILIDAELKSDSNQGIRIIAKRIMLLEEYILQKKFDLILTLNDQSSIIDINLITQSLKSGKSNIFIKFIVDKKIIKINICENVKLSTSLLDDFSKIKNINNIKYSLN